MVSSRSAESTIRTSVATRVVAAFARVAAVVAVTVGLGAAVPAEAQRAERVQQVKLKNGTANKLKMGDEWKKTLDISGDTIRAKRGTAMFRVGDIIYITNDDVTSPPPYQTLKQGVSSNELARGDGTCFVLKQICACASTLIDNMYGGGADDDCGFDGSASRNSCGGTAGCCAYFESEETVECP